MRKQLRMKKPLVALVTAAFAAVTLAACAETGVDRSEDATEEDPMVLQLAHNLADSHVTSIALADFAERVEDDSDGRLTVKIFPNGQLGSETEVLEQLQAGVVDMTRVGSPGLATYNNGYHAFGLPFIFEDEDHFYRALDSDEMREFFLSSYDDGFVGLTYYTSGARSFYTKNTPIEEPADLAGLKIRVQDMRSQTEMMEALDGTPVVMGFGDVYTALQTGIIDGAESNETALTQSQHGEVTKVFSYSEHSMIPDMLVIASPIWDQLTAEDQDLLVNAAIESTEAHKVAWAEEIEASVEQARTEMGVEFVEDIDKAPFQDATAHLQDEFAAGYDRVGDVLDIVDQYR